MQWSWPRYFIKMLIADFYNGFTLLFSSNAGSFSMTTNSMISIFYQQGTNHSTYIVLHFLKTFSYQAVHVFLRWMMANKPLVFFVLKMFFICLVLQKNDLHLIFWICRQCKYWIVCADQNKQQTLKVSWMFRKKP